MPDTHQAQVTEHLEQVQSEGLVAEPISLSVPSVFNPSCTAIAEGEYRLGPQDTLSINVFKEDDISGDYTVDNNGFITMPLVGNIQLSGCSITQARELIKTFYMDGYLIDPSVSVEVSQFKPFYIIGEVRTAGEYDFAVGTTILKAVAIAGGFTYRANQKNIKVLRYDLAGKAYYSDHSVEDNVQPGDVIIIKERFF